MFPAISLQVALHLTEIVNRAVHEGHSVSVIESAAYCIRWGHYLAAVEPRTGHPLPVQPKQPLSHSDIADIT